MDDATVGTMSRIATFVVPGNEWYPTEGLDTRPNGEPQMCAKLRECGIRVNLTAVVAILHLLSDESISAGRTGLSDHTILLETPQCTCKTSHKRTDSHP